MSGGVRSFPLNPPAVKHFPAVRANPVLLATPAPIILVTPVALTQGTRLGPYEIVTPPSAGGRGEVYHARDTQLETVAIPINMVPVREHVR